MTSTRPLPFDLQDFSLEFHFKPNEYFSDAVLVKSYKVACVVSEDDPFSFEGATITSCEGYAEACVHAHLSLGEPHTHTGVK